MLNLAVVGYGYWGPNLVRNAGNLTNAKLYAVCDKDEEKLRKVKAPDSTKRLSKLEEVVNDPYIDAVVVATPAATHYKIAKECLEKGKHVLVEKPLTLEEQDAEMLVRLADEKKLKLGVGHTFLYENAVEKMKMMIDNGKIGKIRHIHTDRLNLGNFQRDTNVVWDLMPHDISIILYLLNGELPEKVSAWANTHYNGTKVAQVEDTAQARLMFKDGVSAYINNSWIHPQKVRRMSVIGTERMIVYDDMQPQEKLRVFELGQEQKYEDFAGFTAASTYGDIVIPRVAGGEPLYRELDHFVRSIEKNEPVLTDGRSGYNVVRIINQVQRAIESEK